MEKRCPRQKRWLALGAQLLSKAVGRLIKWVSMLAV